MCLNKPIQIPTGSNGKSVFIAYASTSTGTGFSYTHTDSLDYISFVTKTGTVTSADFTTWIKFQGTDGIDGTDAIDGTNGTGITNVYVSDGVTAIGGTVYTINTLVVLMTTGTYINAGIITITPTWNPITLLNGWTNGTGVNVAHYSVHGGFLYLRGRIDFTGASDNIFATLASVGNTGTLYSSAASDKVGTVTELTEIALITLTSGGDISALGASSLFTGTRIILDSIPPISIR